MFLAFKNNRNRSRRTPNSSWAVPINTVLVSDQYAFSESGGTRDIQCFGETSRPTSIDIDVGAQVPTNLRVLAYVDGICKFETTYVMVSTTVRHFKFRVSKNIDYGAKALWRVVSDGPMTYAAVCRFSRKEPLVRQEPKVMSQEQSIERRWNVVSTR